MKKKLALLLAGAMLMTAALAGCGDKPADDDTQTPATDAGQTDTTTPADTGSGDTLTMSTNATFPPYEFYEGEKIVGIDAEIAQAIAEKLGMKLEILDMGFDPAIAAAQSGQSDIVMAGLTVTEERKENLNFTDTYATGIQVVIVPENSEITSIDDLEGKLIGVQQGTTGDMYCSDTPENGGYGQDAVQKFESGPLAVEALKNGQVDCVVIDNEPAKSYVEANEGLKILDTEFANEDYAIGIAKSNTELLDKINGALKELKDDGTVKSIIEKYIPAEG